MQKQALTLFLLIPLLLMGQSNKKVSEAFLQSFVNAFNAHDVKAIMSHMSDDCVFEASAGPDFNGEKFTGKEHVGKAFRKVFTDFPDAHWSSARHFISGDRAVSEWIFTGTKTDGTKVEVSGCDLLTFKDGKIAIKNSYRKNRQNKINN
jgi:ketosteroid isomerase-like protein